VAVHRSRYELERVLGRYGASDLAFVEVDANASIQFAMRGRYVQLALPLPDPSAARFTHTPTGRPRTVAAQERAYEQALREHWRALLLAVRGKLQSVESGISTFEDEFAGFLVPHVLEERNGKPKKPRAVNWLLGSSHSLAIAMVAAFLVPASAVSAFALPPTVVDHLSAPFHGVLDEEAGGVSDGRSVALGRSDWVGSESEPAGDETFVPSLDDSASFESEPGGPETGPSSASPEVPAGEPISSEPSSGQGSAPASGGSPASENAAPSVGGGGAPSGGGSGWSAPPPNSGAPSGSAGPPGGEEAAPADNGESGGDTGAPAGGGPPDHAANPENPPADPGNKDKDSGADNGNHNGADNGNGNGADNGNGNGSDKGNNAAADNGNGADNGNHNGADNGANAGETGSGKGKGKSSAGQ
jgi:hypothetical protein